MKTVSNVYLIGFAITICIVVTSASASSNFRKPRTTRGFKNAALSTARGFGKRDSGLYPNPDSVSDVPDDARRGLFGEMVAEPQETDSFPVDWFVEELTSNPRLARLVVKKFIDQNQDGELSADELFRNAGY